MNGILMDWLEAYLRHDVDDALQTLPLLQRTVVRLLCDGFSTSDIADICKRSEAWVNETAERATQQLAQELASRTPTPSPGGDDSSRASCTY